MPCGRRSLPQVKQTSVRLNYSFTSLYKSASKIIKKHALFSVKPQFYEKILVRVLTSGVSRHLNDQFAIFLNLPRIEGADPHRHLHRGPCHGAVFLAPWGAFCNVGLQVCWKEENMNYNWVAANTKLKNNVQTTPQETQKLQLNQLKQHFNS